MHDTVFWLDVAVHNTTGVTCVKNTEKLLKQRTSLFFREMSIFRVDNVVEEASAVEQLRKIAF